MTGAAQRRCAIYTRVSSDGGLEQEFNSLHAQREAAEAFIKSQAHEGWRLRRERYDDGGFSGGSMERPALKQLLADVAARRIDVIVVYKVDRLTRSLADFAKLVELFDRHDVSFVSVTQSFNTTSSMGRLTLNVLLSFAQFEREVTGERIRDKIAASKKKGMWMGGTVPFGYRVDARKLVVDQAEAVTVRLIFERYLALPSLAVLQSELRDRGIRTRRRTSPSGKTTGGVFLTNGPLAHMLRNRTYLGEINHKGKSFAGEHPAIVDANTFAAAQEKLGGRNRRRPTAGSSSSQPTAARDRAHAPLLGRIFDDRGNPMSPSHARKGHIRYRYYVSSALLKGRKADAGSLARVPAHAVEKVILEALRDAGIKEHEVEGCDADMFDAVDLRVEVQERGLRIDWIDRSRSSKRSKETGSFPFLEPIEVSPDDTDIDAARQSIILPFVVPPRQRQREILLPPGEQGDYVWPLRPKEQQNLIRSIAQARGWLREIMGGTSVPEIASREDRTQRSIRMTLSLAFLDPRLVKAIMQGTLLRGISARRLVDAPATWSAQWTMIGLERPS